MASLEAVIAEARACRVCADHLPLGPRPVLRTEAGARLMIIGQAPGTKVHASGIPWDDPSGERLRGWMGIDAETFYDPSRIAIIPMGFCYPDLAASGGDAPPRPECATLWHDRLRTHLPAVELTLLIGGYAQSRYLGSRAGGSVTEAVKAWREVMPDFLPLPHPSWRTRGGVGKIRGMTARWSRCFGSG